jgi:diguanylate cyclase
MLRLKNSSALNILKASHRSIKPMIFMWFVCIVFLANTSGVRAALNDIAPLAERSGFVRFGLAESRKVDGHELVDFLYVLEDKKGLLSLDQVSAKASASSDSLGDRLGAWSKVKHNPSNFGYSSSVYWFYLPTSNLSAGDSDWVLEVAYSVLDFVDFYIVRDGRVIGAYKLGDKQPFSNRVFEHRNFRVPMHLEPGEEADIYIRVSTSSAVQVPVNLWEYGGLMKYDQIDTLIIGLYFGLLMVMALYNGMIYLKVRQRSNLHYVLYVISYSFFQASLMGLSYQYLWPSGIHWNDQSILVSLAFTLVFAAMFIRSYLDLKAHSPKLDLIYRYGAWLGGLFIALSFVLPYALMIRIMVIANTIICLFAMVGGIYLWRSIGRSIQYFTLAWIFLFAGGFILAMNKFGVLPRNFFTENASLYGSAMQVILLSMALVEQLHVERRKRFAAQQRAIVQERLAREAQEHALTLQRQDNERLELRVHERTAELEALNNKLKELTIKDSLTGLFNRRY